MKRINDKINDIASFLDEFQGFAPKTFAEYQNIEKKAACERYLEKIIEAATDLAFMTIKIKKMQLPEDDIDAFNILLKNKVIDENLAKKLKTAKGMRNILAHQYSNIDDEIVFESTKKIKSDVNEFIIVVQKIFNLKK